MDIDQDIIDAYGASEADPVASNTFPTPDEVVQAIAAAFGEHREPVRALANVAGRVQHPAWQTVCSCTTEAVLRLLHDEHPGEALDEAFWPATDLGYLRQLGQALACVLTALEEGAEPERALRLSSYADSIPEVPVLTALVGLHGWQSLERFSPPWQAVIRRHVAALAQTS